MPTAPATPKPPRTARTAILGLLMLLAGSLGWAASDDRSTLTLDDDTRHLLIGQHLQFLEDPTGTLTFNEASAPDQRYHDSTATVPDLGFTRSVYWARFSLHNTTGGKTLWYLDYSDVMFQYIDVFIRDQQGQVTSFVAGSMQTPSANTLKAYTHVFPIRLGWNERVDIYLRLKTDYAFVVPLNLWHPDEYARTNTGISNLHGLYMGIALAMLVYNLALLMAFREWSYLWYVLFVATVLVNNTCLNGLMRFHTDLSSEWLNTCFSSSYNLAAVAGWLFAGAFLNAGRAFNRIKWIGILINIPIIFLYAAGFTLEWCIINGVYVQSASVIIFAFGLRQALQGSRAALFFCLGFGSFLAGVILFTSMLFGLISLNSFTHYATEIGSALEALLLSLALSDKMRQMRIEKDHSQQALQDSQQQQLAMAEHYSRTLEADVAARTQELSARTSELSTKNIELMAQRHALQAKTDELVATQQKLVASEKMAALGVFAAGLAHEINNPANFVAAGTQNAVVQVRDLHALIFDSMGEDAHAEIKDEFDQHFSKISDSLDVIKTGVARIENVVKHLRATHPEGEVGMQSADVVGTLEAAWQVLAPTLKIPVEVSTDFQVRPAIPYLVAEVHQVFLALLGNAVHAIEDAIPFRGAEYRGEIRLSSRQEAGNLVMTVSDNGIGIAANTLEKVFDPFFTTKVVGRGAGLGLSMARDVVTKHGGSLEVQSVSGEGSAFTLVLPVAEHSA